jgi:hypothetical protein
MRNFKSVNTCLSSSLIIWHFPVRVVGFNVFYTFSVVPSGGKESSSFGYRKNSGGMQFCAANCESVARL